VASYLLAALWASIMLARILSSRILLFVSGELLIVAGAAGTAVGALVLMMSHTLAVACLAVLIVGLSSAAIFPTTLGLAAARFEKHSGSVFGILISVALLGGMSLPWVVGQLASAFSLRAALLVVVFDTCAIVLLLPAYRSAATRRISG